ncbi:MAG TPA: TonB-dependent receptor [Longimicrobiales bacterium]|nr:TonB-dependent receptor [Longimicrobiales bacterium]
MAVGPKRRRWRRWRWWRGGLPLILSLLSPGGAVAQVPAPGDTITSDSVPVFSQPAVIVRVLRAPVVARRLPFAITSRDASGRVAGPGLSLESELRAVPGLQIDNRQTDALGDRISIRGFGARSQFGVRGIQVLVDGIPATMPDGQSSLDHLDLALLGRVEVLRGPAAAAYGNAAGGVILLNTMPAPAGALRQEAALTTGSNGLLRLRSTTGGRAGERGWIASVSREWKGGFRPHSDADRIHLTGRFGTPVAGGHLRLVSHAVSYDAENPGALTPDQFATDPAQAQAFNVTQGTGKSGLHGQVGAVWERQLPWAALEATGYAVGRALENPIPPTIIDLDRVAGGARVLLRSAHQSPERPFWAFGLDAALQGDDRQNFENAQGNRGALTLDQHERVTNLAMHGQAILPVLRPVGLFIGARYDRVAFSASDRLVDADDPDDSGSRTMAAISPTLGLRVDLAHRVALFGNVSTAFETPTTTELVNRPDGAGGFNQELEPQRTVSYELGGRAALGAGLEVQGSVYHARITDALVPFEVATAPGRQFFRNAASAVHEGLELLVDLRTTHLDFLAAYDRTMAEFGSYATEDESYDGSSVPGVRPWTLTSVLTGRPGAGVQLELDFKRTGDMPADDANDVTVPGYAILDLRAAGPPIRIGAWHFEPYTGVQNLLDRAYVASVVPNAFGQRFFEPGPGRAFVIGLEASTVREGGRLP